jgi:hypothetical protein
MAQEKVQQTEALKPKISWIRPLISLDFLSLAASWVESNRCHFRFAFRECVGWCSDFKIDDVHISCNTSTRRHRGQFVFSLGGSSWSADA